MKYNIGYVDEDSTQVERYRIKLEDTFNIVSYDIEKGLPLAELLKRVYSSDIDLLMVDFLLVERGILNYNGDEVVRAYEEIKPRFPMIIFTSFEGQAFPQVDNPFIIIEKSLVEENPKKFIQIIEKSIETYNSYIKKRKGTINTLLEKGEKEGLSASEKNILLESQLELKNLDKWSNEVPYQLLDERKFDDLSKTKKEAEAYLESLIKKTKNDSI